MTLPLELKPKIDEVRIRRQMWERVDGCMTSNCWLIKEPRESNKILWLRNKEIYGLGPRQKGRLVQIKRITWCIEYDYKSPLKSIKNYCKDEDGNSQKYCVNPAHCYVPGVKREVRKVHAQIDRGILREEDARAWELFDGEY